MNAVRNAVAAEGYTFYSGFEYRIRRETSLFPAGWMIPPKLTATQGREEGVATYGVTLQLLELNRQYDEPEKVRIWDRMEEKAMRIINRITPAEGVSEARNLTAEPGEFGLTNHGELSLKVGFEVKMFFPNAQTRQ